MPASRYNLAKMLLTSSPTTICYPIGFLSYSSYSFL
nr:MAG TPA: hypothetical protein [Caudoviricetes sp.]